MVLLMAAMLVLGLRVSIEHRGPTALVSVKLGPPPPAPPRTPAVPAKSTAAAKDAPSPRNLRNKATQVVAPPPAVPLASPAPVVVATRAGVGDAASSGAAARPGPGQGAGGFGDGTGGGGRGGDGDGGEAVVGPRQVRGDLSFSDLPEELKGLGVEAVVGVRYVVQPDGSVTNCRIERRSVLPPVDALTCRLIERRFRFRPARDRYGRAVRAMIVESHTWYIEADEPERRY